MARHTTRRRWISVVIIVFGLVVLMIVSYSTYLAGEAGVLPWQVDPTRIAVTPFANIPGFSTPVPSSTPSEAAVFLPPGAV